MRIIALFGRGETGKTRTLNHLREMLRKEGESLSQNPGKGDEPETFLVDGKVVCVAPGGDTREVVDNNLRYFFENRCDVGCTATRTKWGPKEAINEFVEKTGSTVVWVRKSYEEELSKEIQELCNQEMAKVIRGKF